MAIPDGATAPALTQLCRVIREYTLFQAVQQVIERLREAHPLLDEDALYEQLEFQANPGLGFAGHDIDRVEFFVEHDQLRARLRLNILGYLVPDRHFRRFMVNRRLPSDPGATPPATFSTCSTNGCTD